MFNQRDELLVGAESWCFRTERDTARELGTKYDGAKEEPPPYTAEEIERVFAGVRRRDRAAARSPATSRTSPSATSCREW